ncbi:PQQ-binding-like beta-propeller repeat protein, partial [Actinomadura sp. 7K507]|uniref:outer membrane protein assembly factor BamB family protein n=1 Tax=Actinomadura sp. 7K507 TaxID=2530365 RepID=UPI001051C37A
LNSRDGGQGAGFRPWSVDDVRGRAVVADGLVYVGKADGTAAYDARTGRRRWESKSGAEEAAGGLHGGVLLVRSAGRLSALDARSGRRRWQVPVSEDGCLTERPDPAGRVMVAEEVDQGDAPGRLRLSAFGAAAGKPLWSKTLGLSSCGNDLTVGGGRVSVVERGANRSKEQFLVSIAIGSGESWRIPTESVRAMAADDTNVYTVVRGGDDRYRVRAYEAGTGRSRWGVRFPESDLELGGTGLEMSAAGSRLYVLGDEGLQAFDTKDGRRRWTSALKTGGSGEFLVVGSTAYVWWNDTKHGLFRTTVRTAMSAIDLTNGHRRWWERTGSRADVAWADDRTAYIASFRQRRFRPDDNALIALDARTGRERWRRDMDVDDAVIVSSGILYVRDGHTLEAIDATTGEGP